MPAALLARATHALQTQPHLTHCQNPNCERCHDAIAGGPFLPGQINPSAAEPNPLVG